MKELTLEQAVKNIEIVIIEHFRGSRAEHIALEQSLIKVKEYIDNAGSAQYASKTCEKHCPTANCDLDVDNTPATC